MDDGRQQKGSILNVIIVGSIVLLLILDAAVGYYSLRDGAADHEISFAVFSLLPAFFLFVYALARRGYSNLASYLVVGTYFLSNSYAAYRWGLAMPAVLIAYALIIVMATILRGSRFGFIITGTIASYIIPLWYFQFNGTLSTQVQLLRSVDGIVFATLYLLIMTVAWLYNREIQHSLARAERSEQKLKEERDLLEVKVIERTEELRTAQTEKVEQLSRFAELGRLSSGLFHDVLNLLNAIALRDDGSDPSLNHAFDTTKQIERFMYAVRRQIGKVENGKELFSLDEGIRQAIQLVSYKANKNRVGIFFDDGHLSSPNAYSYSNDPYKFHQAILNLLLNAIESYDNLPAIKEDRNVYISIAHASPHRNSDIVIRVKDNGCGMNEETLRKALESFFSTKHGGMGIGLATAKRIIEEDFCGTIAIQSAEGKGSVFTITIPSTDDTAGSDNKIHTVSAPPY